MNFLHDFLHQEVPKSGKTMPAYYRQSLFISEVILAAYFLVSVVLLRCATGRWEWLPIGVLAATGPAAFVLLLGVAGALRRRRQA